MTMSEKDPKEIAYKIAMASDNYFVANYIKQELEKIGHDIKMQTIVEWLHSWVIEGKLSTYCRAYKPVAANL